MQYKIDWFEDPEREKVMDYISQTIRQQTSAAPIKIFLSPLAWGWKRERPAIRTDMLVAGW